MIKVEPVKSIVVIEVVGTPTHIEIQEAIDEFLRHPDHKDGMDEIWDFRKASMASFNESKLRILADFVKERLPKLAKRVAYVIAKDVDYGIGRMWMTYADILNAKQERQLFRNMEEAVAWLASP